MPKIRLSEKTPSRGSGLLAFTRYLEISPVIRHYSVRAQTLTLRYVHSGGVGLQVARFEQSARLSFAIILSAPKHSRWDTLWFANIRFSGNGLTFIAM